MNKLILNHIQKTQGISIVNMTSISGGDISQVYKIETSSINYLLKLNSCHEAFKMFKAENKGLKLIKSTKTIAVPRVFDCGMIENTAFLLMEFIPSKTPSEKDFETLGKNLAKLHKTSSDYFGLESDNFIGSLHQKNKAHQNWCDFYTHERLLPQLHLALTKGLLKQHEIPSQKTLINVLNPLLESVKPSLLHGDLWSGNFIISKEGNPYLIDPAVYFGHNEIDIAMSKLFGGFGNSFYETYAKNIPFQKNTLVRIEIYQLYYLLVHLNLFGHSYHNSVVTLLNKYF